MTLNNMHKGIGIWLDSMYISQNQGFQPPDQVIPGLPERDMARISISKQAEKEADHSKWPKRSSVGIIIPWQTGH